MLGTDEMAANLPPVLPWSGASEKLIVAADEAWITPTEASGFVETPSYQVTMQWLENLAKASPMIKLVPFGLTAEGRELRAVIATREGIDNLEQLGQSPKPTILAQAGIHAGEIDGKDAGMMLLRDMAFRGKAQLLDHANLLFIPILNADGHERISRWNRPNQRGPLHQGWRTTAQNLNLNRDYMKAQAPEMQALLRLITVSKPALYLDIHVTDGVDYQYDITYGFHGDRDSFAWSPQIAKWLDQIYRPGLDRSLKVAGHNPGPLVFALDKSDLNKGIVDVPYNPRFSTGYGDLIHLPTILVENHSLKPFRQRVLGTYILLEASLELAGENATSLQSAMKQDRAYRPEMIGMNWSEPADTQFTMEFLGIASEEYFSPASGRNEVRWLGKPITIPQLKVHRVTQPGVQILRPRAYYLPITSREVIEVIKSHGIVMEPLKEPVTLELESYRLVNPVVAPRPNEGRQTMTTQVQAVSQKRNVPAGTLKISTDQPLGSLAMALLEPAHVDSLAAWGFFNEILQRTEYIEGYAIAPLAEKLLKENSALKAEFEARLASDPAFAKDATARLQWFYEKSPYFDQKYLQYPVWIER